MLRRSRALAHICVALLAMVAVSAGEVAGQEGRYVLSAAESRVWFEAVGSMAPFRGTAGTVRGWTRFTDRERFRDASGVLELDVASFRTGNGTRDRHLRETMAVDSFPRIEWRLVEVHAVLGSGDGSAGVTLTGDLTIRGVTRRVEVPAAITLAGDTLRVSSRLPIRFTEYGMAPPRRILGMVRVADALLLRGEVVFVRDRAPERSGPTDDLAGSPGAGHRRAGRWVR